VKINGLKKRRSLVKRHTPITERHRIATPMETSQKRGKIIPTPYHDMRENNSHAIYSSARELAYANGNLDT
jgi:hypothetical protein